VIMNMLKVPHGTTLWNDYFEGVSLQQTINKQTTRQTPTTSSVYVSNCFFKSITSGSKGGALYCTSVTQLLVESSSFFICRAGGNGGGGIFFSNTGSGECVLHGLCCNDCCTTYTGGWSYGQFATLEVKDSETSKDYFNYSSTAHCVNEISRSSETLCLCNGKIYCQSVNISMNKCHDISAIYCHPFVNLNSFTCSLSYSSFADNNALTYRCIWFNNNAKCEIKCCNILRNSQLNSYGIIHAYGNINIINSCILENKATYIFGTSSSSYTITLSNCTVDSTSHSNGFVLTNSITKSFIHALNHMSTANCQSEYDSVGTLTVIPPSNNRKNIYTCKEIRARISDFLSFHLLFIFTFIHTQ
jgi:hypothetical protein